MGVFDGVHEGHKKVLLDAVKQAEILKSKSVAVTFSVHPRFVLHKTKTEMIMSLEQRLEIFKSLGLDAAVILAFDSRLAELSARDYLENILIYSLNPKSITTGYNHRFGADREGGGRFLEEQSRKYGFSTTVVSPVKIDGHMVSSSAVRKLILKGAMPLAKKFLGRDFTIRGIVVHGQHLGRTMGFPTANLEISEEIIIPLSGVYSGFAKVGNEKFKAVINAGKRPTIGKLKKDLIEAHILDFDKDIYGETIEVSFLDRIRDEIKFSSIDELKAQITKDCEYCKKFLQDLHGADI